MRFVVDLYRNIILGFCALVLIASAILIFAALDRSGPLGSQITGTIILIAVGALGFLVLNLGGIAILISLHDRHVEIAESAESIASSLQRIAGNAKSAREPYA